MRRPAARRGAIVAIILAAALVQTAPGAYGTTQRAMLHATLTPEQLGHATTVGFALSISTPQKEVPPALTELQMRYPAGLGFALSELGLVNCTITTLEYFGPKACPTNSLMGTGTAIAEIQIGPAIIREQAQITIFSAETSSNAISLLINAEGITPVFSDIILQASLLPVGALAIHIPLISPLPGVPDIAIVRLQAEIGPQHLHYDEYTHGHTTIYKPRGIPLPDTCPTRGFQFTAKLTFQNATRTTATNTIPCPPHMSRLPLSHMTRLASRME